jgi:hypothetical protein
VLNEIQGIFLVAIFVSEKQLVEEEKNGGKRENAGVGTLQLEGDFVARASLPVECREHPCFRNK